MAPFSGDDLPSAIALAYALSFVLLTSLSHESPFACFESIISFGDSLADTGNLLQLSRSTNFRPRCSLPPYGETFFHRPNGRYSDGRLVIDFIAESLGLPYIEPCAGGKYANVSDGCFVNGVNFAVAGATALDQQFLEKRGIFNPLTNASLGIQLDWFKQFLATLHDGRRFVQRSLILLGEIGGNDYNYPLEQGANMDELQALVPVVVDYIGQTAKDLIKLGAKAILIPGNLPMGCFPVYLTRFKTEDSNDYDSKTGCLNWLNEFSKHHNELLQKELIRIRELHPHIAIIYADYYNFAMQFYLSPQEFGFETILRACCGGGGPYNYNDSALCGLPSITCCEDPSAYASWDGLHFTEAAYRLIAKGLLEAHFTDPQIRTICSSQSRIAGYSEY